jgi:outer membrane lipopolysaccharide assembly protein LptE/RlpB
MSSRMQAQVSQTLNTLRTEVKGRDRSRDAILRDMRDQVLQECDRLEDLKSALYAALRAVSSPVRVLESQ